MGEIIDDHFGRMVKPYKLPDEVMRLYRAVLEAELVARSGVTPARDIMTAIREIARGG